MDEGIREMQTSIEKMLEKTFRDLMERWGRATAARFIENALRNVGFQARVM